MRSRRSGDWGWVAMACAVGALGCASSAPPCKIDPGIDDETCATLTATELPDHLPTATTNLYADNPDAAMLGFLLFFDQRLSSNHLMSCATCHSPEDNFTERTPTAVGVGTVTRNAPTAINAAWMKTIFWDGRVDVVWAQPIQSLENSLELNFSRLELAQNIAASYATNYEKIFGPLPPLDDTSRFPAAGKPGDPAFDGMAPADQDAVNRVAANFGKAIEAYLRMLATGPSPYDAFLAGDKNAITPHQELGMLLFVQNGCADCHNGPQLSDQQFHNLGVAAWPGIAPDRGRVDGVAREATETFSASSSYSDDRQPSQPPVTIPEDLGAMRTPSLRNVALTAPYMHNGRFATLGDAVDFHLQGGGAADSSGDYVGTVDPLLKPRVMSPDDRDALLDFLGTLNGKYAPLPWSFWPVVP